MDKKALQVNEKLEKFYLKIMDKYPVKKILLYGSYAKDEQDNESDIDFIVLVDDTEDNLRNSKYQIADIMSKLSLKFNLLVSITEETFSRYLELSQFLPFYQNISKEGIEIYG